MSSDEPHGQTKFGRQPGDPDPRDTHDPPAMQEAQPMEAPPRATPTQPEPTRADIIPYVRPTKATAIIAARKEMREALEQVLVPGDTWLMERKTKTGQVIRRWELTKAGSNKVSALCGISTEVEDIQHTGTGMNYTVRVKTRASVANHPLLYRAVWAVSTRRELMAIRKREVSDHEVLTSAQTRSSKLAVSELVGLSDMIPQHELKERE